MTFGLCAEADFRAEEIEDRGADGSAFTFISPEGRATSGAFARWAAQRDERACRVRRGKCLGNWRARSRRGIAEHGAGSHARRSFTFRRRIYRHQRLLQLESRGDD